MRILYRFIIRIKAINSLLAAFALFFINASLSGQSVNSLKLENYRPVSIYKVPVTNVTKAKFPAIDMHTHVYGQDDQSIADG